MVVKVGREQVLEGGLGAGFEEKELGVVVGEAGPELGEVGRVGVGCVL